MNKLEYLMYNYNEKELAEALLQKFINNYIENESEYDEFFIKLNLHDNLAKELTNDFDIKKLVNTDKLKAIINGYINNKIHDVLKESNPNGLDGLKRAYIEFQRYPEEFEI